MKSVGKRSKLARHAINFTTPANDLLPAAVFGFQKLCQLEISIIYLMSYLKVLCDAISSVFVTVELPLKLLMGIV